MPGRPTQPSDAAASWEFIIFLLVVILVFALLLSLIVAVQARRRGYPLLAWLVAGALGNPIFLLVLLGAMPDFRRRRLRKRELADLEDRLNHRGPRVLPGLACPVQAPRPPAAPGAL